MDQRQNKLAAALFLKKAARFILRVCFRLEEVSLIIEDDGFSFRSSWIIMEVNDSRRAGIHQKISAMQVLQKLDVCLLRLLRTSMCRFSAGSEVC